MADDEYFPGSGTRVPVPDPTQRTVEQLMRELANQKELIFTRLDGMDKATDLLQQRADRVPSELQDAITHLRELMETRFKGIDERFIEREVGVTTALQAAKELGNERSKASEVSIAKSEMSTAKLLDQIQTNIGVTAKATEQNVAALTVRIAGMEGRSLGTEKVEQKQHDNSANYIALAALIIAAIIGAATLFRSAPAPAPAILAVPPVVAH